MHTKTVNEHWREEGRSSPYEPFPQLGYFAAMFEAFDLSNPDIRVRDNLLKQRSLLLGGVFLAWVLWCAFSRRSIRVSVLFNIKSSQ